MHLRTTVTNGAEAGHRHAEPVFRSHWSVARVGCRLVASNCLPSPKCNKDQTATPEPGVVIHARASDLKLRANTDSLKRAKPGKLRLMLQAEECQRRADECA